MGLTHHRHQANSPEVMASCPVLSQDLYASVVRRSVYLWGILDEAMWCVVGPVDASKLGPKQYMDYFGGIGWWPFLPFA